MSFCDRPVRLDVGEWRRSNRSWQDAVFADDLPERGRVRQNRRCNGQENDGGIRCLYPVHHPERQFQGGRCTAADNDTATTVRVRDGKTLTTDGPFAETRE